MCGIYGAISLGGTIDMSAIKGLTWANRQRGTDSVGFFDSNGRMIKRACDPADGLADSRVQNWLNDFKGWAIGGHTRYATQGTVKKRNAHPFRYGDIIGTHNGMVDSPIGYQVDSEYLIDTISKDGYRGLEGINGYWGLAWMNKGDGCFYLTMHEGQLSFTVCNDVVYYSSDSRHLASCVGGDTFRFVEGQVVRFDSQGNVEDSEQGQIAGIDVWADWKTNIGFHTCNLPAKRASVTLPAGTSATNVGDDYQAWVERREAGGSAFDGDDSAEDFRDAWKDVVAEDDSDSREYRDKGLHEMSEAEFKEFCTGDVESIEFGGEG